jgi:polar amino acid transport system substrate-binding protein
MTLRAFSFSFAPALALAIAMAGASPVLADQLADIKAKGEIVCGTIGTVPPFSFQDQATRTTVGYDVDICNLIADGLGVKSSIVLVAGAARIPELNQGRLDIVTGTLGWTPDRAKQVDYSHSYFYSNQMIGVLEKSGLTSVTELEGKRVSAQTASTSEAIAKQKLPSTEVVAFQDVPQALLALSQGKVSGLVLSELMLRDFASNTKDTDAALKVLDDSTLMVEKMGVGVRKGEAALLARVNEILDAADKDGGIDKIYDKWFGKDSKFNMPRTFEVAPIE